MKNNAMRFFSIAMIVVFSGCATPQPQYQFEPGTRIGLLIEDQGTRFCHDHMGLTVFGNSLKTDYVLKMSDHAETLSAFKKVAAENQQPLTILEEPDYPKTVSSYFDFNSWSGDATIKPALVPTLQAIMDKYQIDVLVLRAGLSREEYEARPDRADVPWCDVRLETLATKHVIVNAKRAFYAIGGKPLKALGRNAGIGGVLVRDAKPADVKALTEAELLSVVPYAREGIELSVRDFFFELGLGEADFVESQVSFSY